MIDILLKLGIAAGIVALAIILFPSIKGPVNHVRNEVNSKLDAEYVVDNYKAEYVALAGKRAKVLESLKKFKIERALASRKHDFACQEANAAKDSLRKIGTSDMKAFMQAKAAYEAVCTKASNFLALEHTYSNAVAKLEQTLALVDDNMAKAKLKVDTLSSKKTMLDTMKTVNKSIENLECLGDEALAFNVEKLDDDTLRETIKLEAFSSAQVPVKTMSEAEAKEYLDSLD